MNNKRFLLISAIIIATNIIPFGKCGAQTMRDVLGKHFLIGAAVNTNVVYGIDARGAQVVKNNFNAIVAENCMKGEAIHPEEDRYNWTDADRTLEFAKMNNLRLTGHCLVWHSQQPRWMFVDKEGKKVTRAMLIDRMYHHITTVVRHFKGQIIGWDVVNESVNDDGTMRHTPYYDIIGPDYIELAFRFAHEADPDAELYLNDYSTANPKKRATYCRIIRELKAKGIRIDAMGMQSHNGLDYPDLKEWEASIDSFAACGVKVMLTEFDLNVLPSPERFGGAEVSQNFNYKDKLDPYRNGITKEATKRFEQRYIDMFNIIKRHKEQISRVTFWGVDDGTSWLNDFPVHGRTNYPLFFDRNYKAKPIVNKIIKMFK